MAESTVHELIAQEEREQLIGAFLARHGLDDGWRHIIERGWWRAAEQYDPEDPIFPKCAYWFMRHELYCEQRKETEMEKTVKSTTFRWSADRKRVLAEKCRQGMSVSELAAHFGVEEEIIYKAIDKFNLQAQIIEAGAPQMDSCELTTDETINHDSEAVSCISEQDLLELNRLINHAYGLTTQTPKLFLKDLCYEAFFALGQQDIVLQAAQRILQKAFPGQASPLYTQPSPEP